SSRAFESVLDTRLRRSIAPIAITPPATAVTNNRSLTRSLPAQAATAAINFTSPAPIPPSRNNTNKAPPATSDALRPSVSPGHPDVMHRTSKAPRKPEYVSRFGILLPHKSSTAPATARLSPNTKSTAGHLRTGHNILIVIGRKN